MATTEELRDRLERVQAAIDRLLEDGQSWTRGQRQRTEAQLNELRKERDQLEQRLARRKAGGIRLRQVAPDV